MTTREPLARIIASLVPFVRVSLLVNDATVESQEVLERVRVPGAEKMIDFREVRHSDIWMRDFGPIFVRPPGVTPCHRGLEVLSFDWTAWGYLWNAKNPEAILVVSSLFSFSISLTMARTCVARKDENVSRDVASLMKLQSRHIGIASEGGDRTFNGKGTMITSRVVEAQRNPKMRISEIDQILKNTFSLKKIIWIGKGVPEDEQTFDCPVPEGSRDGFFTGMATGGHVDEV